jgi:hypothetical protein
VALTGQLGKRAKKDSVSWTKVDLFFANMGGFVIMFNDSSPDAVGGSPLGIPSPKASPKSRTEEVEVAEDAIKLTVVIKTGTIETDCEKALHSPPRRSDVGKFSSTNFRTARMPMNQKALKIKNNMCWLIAMGQKSLPATEDKDSQLLFKTLSDLKQKILSDEDIGSNLVINIVRLSRLEWALSGTQLIRAR